MVTNGRGVPKILCTPLANTDTDGSVVEKEPGGVLNLMCKSIFGFPVSRNEKGEKVTDRQTQIFFCPICHIQITSVAFVTYPEAKKKIWLQNQSPVQKCELNSCSAGVISVG